MPDSSRELGEYVLERRIMQEQVLSRADMIAEGLERPESFAELDLRARASDARVRKVHGTVGQGAMSEVRREANASFSRIFDALEGLGEAHA